jgi:hypothetical protein
LYNFCLVKPRAVEETKFGVLFVPNSFIPGRRGSIRIEIAANPNLTAAHWTVNGKEADGQKFKPLSLNQTRFQQV